MSPGFLHSAVLASPRAEDSQDQWTTPLQREGTPTALAGMRPRGRLGGRGWVRRSISWDQLVSSEVFPVVINTSLFYFFNVHF